MPEESSEGILIFSISATALIFFHHLKSIFYKVKKYDSHKKQIKRKATLMDRKGAYLFIRFDFAVLNLVMDETINLIKIEALSKDISIYKSVDSATTFMIVSYFNFSNDCIHTERAIKKFLRSRLINEMDAYCIASYLENSVAITENQTRNLSSKSLIVSGFHFNEGSEIINFPREWHRAIETINLHENCNMFLYTSLCCPTIVDDTQLDIDSILNSSKSSNTAEFKIESKHFLSDLTYKNNDLAIFSSLYPWINLSFWNSQDEWKMSMNELSLNIDCFESNLAYNIIKNNNDLETKLKLNGNKIVHVFDLVSNIL